MIKKINSTIPMGSSMANGHSRRGSWRALQVACRPHPSSPVLITTSLPMASCGLVWPHMTPPGLTSVHAYNLASGGGKPPTSPHGLISPLMTSYNLTSYSIQHAVAKLCVMPLTHGGLSRGGMSREGALSGGVRHHNCAPDNGIFYCAIFRTQH